MSGPALAGGGLGIGGLVLLLIFTFLGGNPEDLKSQIDTSGLRQGQSSANLDPEAKEFVSVVLADTEDVWVAEFDKRGRTYQKPKLVLFSGSVDSACGMASSAMGPFYCPSDDQVYIDLSFYEQLKTKFGAPGDFAQAYVIAHEVGHHIQNQLGVSKQVHDQRSRLSEKAYNELSVRMELQADFYAGVWAHHAKRMADLDTQDLKEAIRAANAIGDDTLQRKMQGRVVPDAFTHGTSEQRMRWFLKGWESGRMEDGDTFRTTRL